MKKNAGNEGCVVLIVGFFIVLFLPKWILFGLWKGKEVGIMVSFLFFVGSSYLFYEFLKSRDLKVKTWELPQDQKDGMKDSLENVQKHFKEKTDAEIEETVFVFFLKSPEEIKTEIEKCKGDRRK